MIAIDGNFTTSGGTSASAPIFASLIAAINDARISVGKGPVGWLNPAVRYSPTLHHVHSQDLICLRDFSLTDRSFTRRGSSDPSTT